MIEAVEAGGDEANKEAAKQLEAYFLRRVLAEVKIGQGGMLSEGFAAETFQQMYSEAIADAMAEAGGIGISDVIMRELSGDAAELANRSPASRMAAAPLGLDGAEMATQGQAARITSPFGSRIHPVSGDRRFHAGVDLAAASGTPALAAAAGKVIRAEPAGDYGNLVVLRHPGGLETRYAHLERIDVGVGSEVKAGQAIGAVGQSGNATGPHLHFEVRAEGVAVDPEEAVNLSDLLTEQNLHKKDGGALKTGRERTNRTRGGY